MTPRGHLRALGLTPRRIQHYLDAMERTPSGREARTRRQPAPVYSAAGIDFTPPEEVAEAALRALSWRFQDRKRGGTDIGVGRAIQLALRLPVPPRDIDRMVSYFSRHARDLAAPAARTKVTSGVVAWDLWGGAPGHRWAHITARRMDAVDDAPFLGARR